MDEDTPDASVGDPRVPTPSAGHRLRALRRPWWRVPAMWVAVVLFTATASRFLVGRGRSYPAELGASAVTATVLGLVLLLGIAAVDRRDRRRGR